MNFRTTIVLVVLVLIVAAVWFFVPSPKPAEEKAAEPPATKTGFVFDPEPVSDKIVRVELARAGQPPMVFERQPIAEGSSAAMAEWRMLAPVAAPVEAYQVRGIATTLSGLESRQAFEPGSAGQPTVVETGLETPAVTVTLTDDAGKTYKLEVGNKAPLSSDTYVRRGGETKIRVAGRDLLPQLRKAPGDFRAKRVLSFKPDEAVHLRMTYDGRTYDLARGPDREWVFSEPIRGYADRDKVTSLVSSLSNLRVDEFVADEPAALTPYGLAQPYLTLEVTTETKKQLPTTAPASETQPAEPQFETVTATHGLVFGAADLKSEKRYVKLADAPWVALANETYVKPLIPNLRELRDARIVRVKAGEITALGLGPPGQSVQLQKSGSAWQGTGDLERLETAAVTDVVDALEDLRAVDFVDVPAGGADLSQYGLDPPRSVVTITAAGLVAPLTLNIGADTASGKNTYVQIAGQPTVAVTSAAQAARVAISPLALRAREVFDFPTERLRSITVERAPQPGAGSASQYVVTRQAGIWKLEQPADAPIDPAAARTLATDLSHLRAKRVVARDADAQYGLASPALTIRFEVEPPPPPATQPAATQPAPAEPSPPTEQSPSGSEALGAAPAEPPATAAPESPPPPAAQPPVPAAAPESHTLRVAWHEGAAYARKDDEPFVFELDETVYKAMSAELIDPRIFTGVTAADVTGVKLVQPDGTLEFVRDGENWKLAADPFVELDAAKVQELAGQLAQLRAESWLAYSDGDLAAAGLAQTPSSVTLRLKDGRELTVNLTADRPGDPPSRGALVAERRIFKLRSNDAEKLTGELDDYLKTEPAPAAQPAMPPGARPPMPPGAAQPRPVAPPKRP